MQQVGIKYCRHTAVAQKRYNIKLVFTMFSSCQRLYLSWARWIQTVSRIVSQYISVSLWNRNLTLGNGFRAVCKKGNLYFVTHCMCSTTCNGMFDPPITQIFLSFLWVWNVTSYIERITCFEGLWGKSYQIIIWPLEVVNNRTQKYNEVGYWNCS